MTVRPSKYKFTAHKDVPEQFNIDCMKQFKEFTVVSGIMSQIYGATKTADLEKLMQWLSIDIGRNHTRTARQWNLIDKCETNVYLECTENGITVF